MNKISKLLTEFWPFFLGLLIGIYFITLTIMGIDLAYFPGDLGDARFNTYILEHGYRFFFVGDVPSSNYWDAPFMYPQESIITFSDNLLGVLPIYSLFRLLGFGIYTSFQLWYISLVILNYTAAYCFFQWLLKNRFSSVLGALVFTFSIALYSQVSHAQTYPRFCIPLAFLFASRFHSTLSNKDFLLTIFMVVYQFYCAMYLGFMLMVPIAAMLLSSIVIKRKSLINFISSKRVLTVLIGIAFNIILMLPLIIPYMNSPALSLGLTDYKEVFITIPLFKSFYFISTYTYMWSSLNTVANELPAWWDHQLFPGAIVIFSSLFLFFFLLVRILQKKLKKDQSLYISLGVAIIVTFLFFTRTDDFSMYQYIKIIPGFASMRSIGRIINVELLFFGLIVALTYSIIAKHTKYKGVIFILLLAIFIPDNYVYSKGYSRRNKFESNVRISFLEKEINKSEKSKIVCLEKNINEEAPYYYQIDAMLAAQLSGRKTINGYTSRCPLGYALCGTMNKNDIDYWINLKNLNEDDIVFIQQNFDLELAKMIIKIKNDGQSLEELRNQADEKNTSLEDIIRYNAVKELNNKL